MARTVEYVSHQRENAETQRVHCRRAPPECREANRCDKSFHHRSQGNERCTLSLAPKGGVPRQTDVRESREEPPDSEVPRRPDRASLRQLEIFAHLPLPDATASQQQGREGRGRR